MPNNHPARPPTVIHAARNETADEVLDFWRGSLASDDTRRNFAAKGRCFLGAAKWASASPVGNIMVALSWYLLRPPTLTRD